MLKERLVKLDRLDPQVTKELKDRLDPQALLGHKVNKASKV